MKTTNKLFKEQVQTHILECLSTDETEVVSEQLKNVVNDFHNWYSAYEQKRIPNCQDAFMAWLLCLPSSLSVEFTNYGIHETLKKWFETCDTPYKEQKSDKETNLYYALVYREFNTLCKKQKVEVFA